MTITRRLAAILAADVAGYSAMMEHDEEGTFARVRALRREVIEPKLAQHQGRLIKTTGDGFLAEFASPVAALRCAMAIQARPAEDDPLRLRIGLNLGDVIIEDGDVYGEGVNVAARLEALAEAGGILVSDKIHREVAGKAEATFEDRGEQQVKNISKRVRAYAVRTGAASRGSPTSPIDNKLLAVPDKPSISVLPFENMSGDPEQEYFADGMVEDIITALSRFKSLFVIARNSSFTYKGKAVDIKQVGRELGVRYVLEGSVRKAGVRVRITGQLIEADTGSHLWAEKFDGSLEDVFSLQDDVATRVVGAIVPRVASASFEHRKQRSPELWTSYDHYLRGNDYLHRQYTPEGARQALGEFRTAIKMSPNFASGLGAAALCIYTIRNVFNQPVDERTRTEALQIAARSIELDSEDAGVLTNAAFVLANLNDEFERGAALAAQAVVLNSNYANAWNAAGWMNLCLGNVEVASDAFGRALRLNPVDPILVPNLQNGLACACMFDGRHDEGVAWAEQVLARRPSNLLGLIALTGNSLLLGREAEAELAAVRIRKSYPTVQGAGIKALYPLRKKEHQEILNRVISCLERPE